MEIENREGGGKHPSAKLALPLAAAAYGDSIRKRKAIADPPKYLYLVHIRMERDELVVRHVENTITGQVSDEEDKFIGDALLGKHKYSNFPVIVFTRPSYFTLVLDEDGWDFYYPLSNVEDLKLTRLHDPITFLENKATNVRLSSGAPVEDIKKYEPNYSFYYLERITKRIDGQDRNAIRCVNHFTDATGRPPPYGTDIDYGFNINLLIPYSRSRDEKVLLTIDPDTQNQGQPGFIDKGD